MPSAKCLCGCAQATSETCNDLERAAGLMADFDRRSENAKRAIRRRRRCKDTTCGALVGKGELYCSRHKHAEMPF